MPAKTSNTISLKSILDAFKNYWGYVMTLVTAVTFIWTIGVKSERKNDEKISLKEDLTEIKGSISNIQTTQTKHSEQFDTVMKAINKLNQSQTGVVKNMNALRNSYVKYISNDDNLTKKDFYQYMDGIQFELPPIKSAPPVIDTVKTDFNIKVRKLK